MNQSEGLSSGEACVNVVPPFDLIAFAELPAEQYDAPVAQGGKVYKAAFIIFELNAKGFKLARERSEFHQKAHILWAVGHAAAALFRAFGSTLRGLSIA
jgi:hypothetical protein